MGIGGQFISEEPSSRAVRSFAKESLQKTMSATISTAIGYCLFNIIDNFQSHKVFDLSGWITDISNCGRSFDWTEMMRQSAVLGASTGAVHGAMKAMEEVNIVKWTYKPPSFKIQSKKKGKETFK